MDFATYQRLAQGTCIAPDSGDPLLTYVNMTRKLGVIGDAVRELPVRRLNRAERRALVIAAGDLQWYLSDLLTFAEVKLEEVAAANLARAERRWGKKEPVQPTLFADFKPLDDGYPENERFPQPLRIKFEEVPVRGAPGGVKTRISWRGHQLGDLLDDNANTPDGYRFHDALHLAYVAHLSWSPVIRSLLKRKRKSTDADRTEDGAGAGDAEEAVTKLIHKHAETHDFFRGRATVDTSLLETISVIVRDLEVSVVELRYWERAILDGYRVWRKLIEHRGGYVSADVDRRRLTYEPLKLRKNKR